MPRSPVNIKVIVAAGARPADAFRAALPGTFAEFAAKHDLLPPHVSSCIHGRQRHDRVRAALAQELGVEREWVDQILDSIMSDLAKEGVA